MKDLTQNDFKDVLSKIKNARQKSYAQVNATLLQLYWEIGKYIYFKVQKERWGKGVVIELANYIKNNAPGIKGFTDKNLWRMKQFYEIYGEDEKLATLWRQLTWSHNRAIMPLKTEEEREFYLRLCAREKYSVRELERQINTGTFERIALADKNMSTVVKELPQNADHIFKDSYVFDFLDLPPSHNEKDLQKALVASLREFILEIGKGFTFMGQDYRLQVGNDDFYIDLLFFHRDLQCLVAFELKVDKFRPAHLGQLEFYLEALDRDVRKPHENPSIGVLLCREKNDEVVEYALSRSISPAVISEYETKLIPKEVLRAKLNEFYTILEGGDE